MKAKKKTTEKRNKIIIGCMVAGLFVIVFAWLAIHSLFFKYNEDLNANTASNNFSTRYTNQYDPLDYLDDDSIAIAALRLKAPYDPFVLAYVRTNVSESYDYAGMSTKSRLFSAHPETCNDIYSISVGDEDTEGIYNKRLKDGRTLNIFESDDRCKDERASDEGTHMLRFLKSLDSF